MALQGSYAEMYRKQAMNYLAVDSVEDMVCRLTFRLRVNRNPLERKRDYVKRVFYMQYYAKELRLNPKAAEVLYWISNNAMRKFIRWKKAIQVSGYGRIVV
ncbi:MAG: hypothetical protein K2J04_07905 [Lachnospiraceae bacterium]|nr:hypothetical protein [Lachnospiraceae bacterium]